MAEQHPWFSLSQHFFFIYMQLTHTKHLRSFVSLKRIERGACTNALLSKLFPMTQSRMGRECNSLRENNNIQIALAKMFCYRASDTLRAAVANDIITIHILFTWRSLLPNRWLVMNYQQQGVVLGGPRRGRGPCQFLEL